MMKYFLITTFFLASTVNSVNSQSLMANDTLKLNRTTAEAIFLEKNLQLISEKLNIDLAEAQVIQAKLWPNPNLTVDEINLWSNGSAEELPPLFRDFGRTTQISAGLEQVIITAGKRKKMIAMEKIGVNMAKEYFKDFLRNLKIEFRNNLTNLQYTQSQQSIYAKQLSSVQRLLNAYNNQLQLGNISKSEYIRLKASELEYIKEIADLQKENNELQKELKTLMNITPNTFIYITEQGFVPDLEKIRNLNPMLLIKTALENRPDLKASRLEEEYFSNSHKYEKAQRTPDVTLNVGYDRAGNIMRDFVGVGFSLDLPFFSRNQGNIKSAQLNIEKSKVMTEEKSNRTQLEVIKSYQDLLVAEKLYKNIDSSYEKDLDILLESHLKNFTQRNMSMIEYLDFVEAYLTNKIIILDSKKELNENFEELQFVIGKEI